jgi:hypothetical protein
MVIGQRVLSSFLPPRSGRHKDPKCAGSIIADVLRIFPRLLRLHAAEEVEIRGCGQPAQEMGWSS